MFSRSPLKISIFLLLREDLYFRIPSGTSRELSDLLNRMLRRNARDRIDIEGLLNHTFVNGSNPVSIPCGRNGQQTTRSPSLQELSCTRMSPPPQLRPSEPQRNPAPRKSKFFIKSIEYFLCPKIIAVLNLSG